jgi:DNA-binding IscR family transcriptional regulator
MQSLGHLLRSAARTEILRVLVLQPGPVSLRQAARLAGVHPRSAQLVFAGLRREGLVSQHRSANRLLYALNRNHWDVPILDAVFAAAARAQVRTQNAALQDRARHILPFVRQAAQLVNRGRGARHVA